MKDPTWQDEPRAFDDWSITLTTDNTIASGPMEIFYVEGSYCVERMRHNLAEMFLLRSRPKRGLMIERRRGMRRVG